MLIAPQFGLCACGTGGGQKFPLSRARPVQGLLRFLGMLAKDDRKVNMEQAQYFLFLLTRRASNGPSPFPLFLSKECPAVADLHCFHSHTVRLGSAWRRCPLDTD